MKPSANSNKIGRKDPRQLSERRTLIEASNGKLSTEDEINTRKAIPMMEMSNGRPLSDKAPAPDEGAAWEQRRVWSLEVGENILRILPPYDNKGYVYEKIPHHWGVGPDERGIICRSYIGKRCFICVMIDRLWRSGLEADREIAKRMALNVRFFFNVIDVKDPTRGVLVWGTSEAMTAQLLQWFNPQFPDATDPQHGRNIAIVKTGEGQNSRYSAPKLAPTPSAIPYARWMREIKHLDRYLRIPSWELQRRTFEGL
jgi:hypothetical protein